VLNKQRLQFGGDAFNELRYISIYWSIYISMTNDDERRQLHTTQIGCSDAMKRMSVRKKT